MLAKTEGAVRSDSLGNKFITPVGEKALMDIQGGIVWLTNMDKRIVPFYQAVAEDQQHALCADLLFGIGEVVGAGQRHLRAESVEQALKEHGVDEDAYRWYIEMRKQYPMQTSGFGLGTERFILWLLQHDDIRDCQLLPRFNRLTSIV